MSCPYLKRPFSHCSEKVSCISEVEQTAEKAPQKTSDCVFITDLGEFSSLRLRNSGSAVHASAQGFHQWAEMILSPVAPATWDILPPVLL